MSNRYRWYLIKFPEKNFDFESAIAAVKFSLEDYSGFKVIENDLGDRLFRFLYRTKIQVTSIGLDGTEITENINSIKFIDFSIFEISEITFLRIENPTNSNRDLFNALEAIVGFGFMAKSITFEKTQPFTLFDNVDSHKLVGLKVIGAIIDKDLVARMEFASKQGIDINKVKSLQGIEYRISSASYEIYIEGIKGHLCYSSSGLTKITGQLSAKILHYIEKDLPIISK